jgi:hypothetical protein
MNQRGKGAIQQRLWTSPHLRAAIAVLLLIGVVGWVGDGPIRSIFPYALAVGLVALGHGMVAGCIFAGLVTLAALATGVFPSRPDLIGQEMAEGAYAYLKLSAIAAGVTLAKRASRD